MAAGLLDMHNSRREELYFFFQAEDGIRGWSVTGVQTCALPISRLDVPERVLDAAAEGRDLDAARVHLIDHVPGRRAERVHEQPDRVRERDLDLRAGAGVRPGEQPLVRLLALGQLRHPVALEHLLD